MPDDKRLYERATTDPCELDALWHVEEGRTFFAGPLDYNASHQHGAPVYLAGLYGSFGLRMEGGKWLSCRTAVIPAGVRHELDIGGNPLAVFYIEPDLAGVDALTPLVRSAREVDGALVGSTGEVSLLRMLYEDRASTRWAGSALTDLLGFARRRASRQIDPRVSRVVESLYARYDDRTPVAQRAGWTGLSASRFQHLFTQEVGVPFRRYRAWHRMRAAIREIVRGSNFTTAAHAAGFADQAHFAHDFRRTFGAPASRSLSRVRV
ncbi:MAG: AraC family transcriptional regulator [Gemmatimonadales bacterium]|nr:AraC family transcriptional regulator [Gemmatimonadales bacterium]